MILVLFKIFSFFAVLRVNGLGVVFGSVIGLFFDAVWMQSGATLIIRITH